MYAVIESGNEQIIVSEGTIVDVEKLDTEVSKSVTIKDVLMTFDDKKSVVGQPFVKGASVKATVLEQKRDDKVTVFKFKRKTGYKVTQGHRQYKTVLRIDKITTAAAKAAPAKTAEATEDKAEKGA